MSDVQTQEAVAAKSAGLLYGVFAASLLTQFYPDMLVVLAGALVLIIALILAYTEAKAATGTFVESHFRWIKRTFWIGTGVYLPIITVAMALLIVFTTDMLPMFEAMQSGDPSAALQASALYLAQNLKRIETITLLWSLPFLVWWLYRCGYGAWLLLRKQAIPRSASWL